MRPFIPSFIHTVLAASLLAACASAPPAIMAPTEPPFLESAVVTPEPLVEPEPAIEITPISELEEIVLEAAVSPEPASQKPERAPEPVTPRLAAKSLADANSGARQRAAPGTFKDATLRYAYEPGAIYELQTSPDFVSTLLLEPGEVLIDIAAADTARWSVSNTVSASQTILIVKPSAPRLKTNIVLVTDRRAYLIEAVSVAGDVYTAQAAWTYPARPEPPPAPPEPEPEPRPIHEDYVLKAPRKGPPAWMPQKVWDDGVKTYVQFPDDIAATDMPPLFIRTAEGLELVNYRTQGTLYEIDRIFSEAELRLGRKKPVVVSILRQAPRGSGDEK
jgi:type IV secretion system protein VirB9